MSRESEGIHLNKIMFRIRLFKFNQYICKESLFPLSPLTLLQDWLSGSCPLLSTTPKSQLLVNKKPKRIRTYILIICIEDVLYAFMHRKIATVPFHRAERYDSASDNPPSTRDNDREIEITFDDLIDDICPNQYKVISESSVMSPEGYSFIKGCFNKASMEKTAENISNIYFLDKYILGKALHKAVKTKLNQFMESLNYFQQKNGKINGLCSGIESMGCFKNSIRATHMHCDFYFDSNLNPNLIQIEDCTEGISGDRNNDIAAYSGVNVPFLRNIVSDFVAFTGFQAGLNRSVDFISENNLINIY
jgi:hypothetical protein